jgi:hypothetical protein
MDRGPAARTTKDLAVKWYRLEEQVNDVTTVSVCTCHKYDLYGG